MLKKYISLLLAALFMLNLSACGGRNATNKYSVAVITKATDSDFWHNVQRGVNAAATEYNVSATFEGPESEEDYLTQNEMIVRAVANGVQVIVLSAIDYNKSADTVAAAAAAGVKIITIDSGVNSDKISAFIGTNNYEAGRMAGQAAAQQTENSGKRYIGLVNYDQNSDNGQKREAGFRSCFENDPGAEITAVINVDSNTTSATAGAITMLRSHPQINVIVGFNEWMTLGIGSAVEQLGVADTVCAIGFDSNVISIGMLETGEMDALIVQNPFAMGYLGIQSAWNLLSGKTVEGSIETATSIITQENMFDENSQKALFPF